MLKFPKYIKNADDAATLECISVLRELYQSYGTDAIAEAHHQLRREWNLIEEVVEKKRRVAKIQQELDDIPE